jgi:hypothetical protein
MRGRSACLPVTSGVTPSSVTVIFVSPIFRLAPDPIGQVVDPDAIVSPDAPVATLTILSPRIPDVGPAAANPLSLLEHVRVDRRLLVSHAQHASGHYCPACPACPHLPAVTTAGMTPGDSVMPWRPAPDSPRLSCGLRRADTAQMHK